MAQFATALPAAATLTAARRLRFPASFVRKDARNQVLRLTYGPQAKFSNGAAGVAGSLPQAARSAVEEILPRTGYDAERCREILADFDRLRKGRDG